MSAKPHTYVDGDRLWSRMMSLAEYGKRPDGGVDRQALTEQEIAARAQIVRWGRELGLTPFTDAAANLFLRLEGTAPALPAVVVGSHIDSQPTGGKFDGAFGVMSGLEAVNAIISSGKKMRRSIEVVAWTNEEASRFAPGMTGSCVFTNRLSISQAEAIKDAAGISFAAARDLVLAADDRVALRDMGWPIASYVEPHIEQATRLEEAGVPIGVVTGIQGTRRYRVTILGEPAHAGTAEREVRRDAMLATARILTAIDGEAARIPGFKFTAGMVNVKPNAPSVVPQEVLFSIDIRHVDDQAVDEIDAAIYRIVEREKGRCDAIVKEITHAPSVHFDAIVQSKIAACADALGIPHMPVFSAAGHDARQLSYVAPAGMIFIPCRKGISHSPEEWSEPEHLWAATQILAELLVQLASE
ncbi:hydantoinase/carbamoylase family amidase (plasmid) [Rhizobium sp. CB3060]|uniref:hydantoinase/carbamoylase family amidase n=1 Tax=Rhizobium sp. CB3060 TaxID=3138255 RepID=UPI0021A3D4EE|nr:hydantoinase/carbamoylase family amidase [Rhizobium tropici]UWU25495.1 hydantoinase/carbamoylase family amidase [Rhizobium tropici]